MHCAQLTKCTPVRFHPTPRVREERPQVKFVHKSIGTPTTRDHVEFLNTEMLISSLIVLNFVSTVCGDPPGAQCGKPPPLSPPRLLTSIPYSAPCSSRNAQPRLSVPIASPHKANERGSIGRMETATKLGQDLTPPPVFAPQHPARGGVIPTAVLVAP